MLHYSCLACNQHFTAPESASGVRHPCSRCGQEVQAPTIYQGPTTLYLPRGGKAPESRELQPGQAPHLRRVGYAVLAGLGVMIPLSAFWAGCLFSRRPPPGPPAASAPEAVSKPVRSRWQPPPPLPDPGTVFVRDPKLERRHAEEVRKREEEQRRKLLVDWEYVRPEDLGPWDPRRPTPP